MVFEHGAGRRCGNAKGLGKLGKSLKIRRRKCLEEVSSSGDVGRD